MGKNLLNIISLFTGAGGLEIAACSTGKVKRIVSTDSNEIFLETTKLNLPQHFPNVEHRCIVSDARDLKGISLLSRLGSDVDLVMGGPPCDDFTPFGRRKGMEGDKGPLIYDFLRLIDELRPRCFLFENVPNLIQQFRSFFDAFIGQAETINYRVDWRLLSASDYGAPTMRKRVILVGWNNETRAARDEFKFPNPTHTSSDQIELFVKNFLPASNVCDVLENLPDVGDNSAIKYHNHTGRKHRPKTVAHLKTVPQGVHVKKSYRYRAPWKGLCRSLTAGVDHSTKSYIHPVYHREMSVREYARIHGFMDSWVFSGNHHNGIKQVANAVPIPLGKAVLKNVINALCEV